MSGDDNRDGKKVSLPLNEAERKQFIEEELKPLTEEQIADKRYTTDWGTYSKDPTLSSWKVRQANRYLTEFDRRRELRPVLVGVWVGVLTLIIAS